MRHLRDIIGQYWEKARPPSINDMGSEEAQPISPMERLWNRMLDAGGCVECSTLPKRMIEGPSGGVSTNIFCAHCGQGYNVTPIGHWAEKIHVDQRYVRKEK